MLNTHNIHTGLSHHTLPSGSFLRPKASIAIGPLEGDRKSGTHTLERALTVLKSFSGYAGPLANAELVRRTGFSKASISRITVTLVSLGYLDRASDGVRFQIGMRGPLLGHTYRANSAISALVRPIMQAFADQHGTSVALAIGDGCDVLYIEYCKSARIATLRTGVGTRMPIALTSIGRAWLWAQPPEQRQRLMESIRLRTATESPLTLAGIERAFEELDISGYCIVTGEYQRDSYGISVPVHLGAPRVPLGLNCGNILPAPPLCHIRSVLVPGLIKAGAAMAEATRGVNSKLI